MDFEPGSRVGDYEILNVLGAGGMGKVYKVRNTLSDRVEAMKVVLPALGQEGELTDRFIREIKVQASLEHPNIAALHTAQQVGGQILMIMEYVEGSSIDALLAKGPLAPGDAANYASQVLDALEYAHARGVVHRDIKPGNIIVTPAGVAKLMDFGIAKFALDRKLTMTGRTLGSLYYMSPEQIQGAATVDARSDIYSLGICLYEMATGKRPFTADSDYALMVAHLELAPTPPIAIDPSLPEALNDIILMAIQKDPAQRFQTAAAFRAALRNVPMGSASPAPVQTKTLGAPASPAPAVESVPAVDAVAPPVAGQGQAAAETPAARQSRRGLYMALGSIVTVAVLVAAFVAGPRLFSSKQAAAPVDIAPPQAQPPQPAEAPQAQSQSPPVELAPQATEPPAARQTSSPTPAAAHQPRSGTPAPVRAQPAPAMQRAQSEPVENRARPAPSAPPQTEPAAPPQTPAAAHSPAAGDAAELNAVRDQYNQLAIRAGVAKSGLQSLQNQMGGLGLRADMREAATRLDYLLQEARTALTSGNAELAKRNIDLADRTLERIEKFLGR
jgi:hypothetical protein